MNTKVKSILCLSIILIIVLICYLSIKVYLSSTKHQVSYIYDDEIYDDSLIYPSHIYIISNNYDGDISLITINKSINNFCAKVIPNLFEKFKTNHSDNEIQKFFNNNKNDIRLVSGIDDYEEFYELINTITKYDSTNFILRRIEIDTEDYGWNGAQFDCNMVAYYDNNCELNIYLSIEEDIINKKISPIHYSIEQK